MVFTCNMASTRQTRFKNTDILNASEIGQYHYCSIAWHLQKCGYEPQSLLLDEGTTKHEELGRIIDNTQKNIRKSRVFAIIGYLLLLITSIIFIFEVVL